MTRHDEEAFDAFARERAPELLRTAILLVGDRTRAEKALHAALSRAWRSWGADVDAVVDGAEGPRDEAAADVALRVLVAAAGKAGRRASSAPVDGAGAGEELRAAARDALRHRLGELPPGVRAVVVLRLCEGLPAERVARLLGEDVAAVAGAERAAVAALARDARLAPFLVLEPSA